MGLTEMTKIANAFLLLTALLTGVAVFGTMGEDISRADGDQDPDAQGLIAGCQKVWSGTVRRLRIYSQPGTTGEKVFAYTGTGSNSDYVGWTADQNVIKTLFASVNSGSLTGYTNSSCKLEWLDYRG